MIYIQETLTNLDSGNLELGMIEDKSGLGLICPKFQKLGDQSADLPVLLSMYKK